MVVPYYGNKGSEGYYRGVMPLLPDTEIRGFVDSFMGGGSVTVNLGAELGKIPKIAMDADKSIIALHRTIQNNPDGLIESVEKLEYSQENFDLLWKKIEEYCNGTAYDELEIAIAVYATLFMARNNMHTKSFRKLEPSVKYKKDAGVYNKKKRQLDALGRKLHERLGYIVSTMHHALADVHLVHDSILGNIHLWEREGWLWINDPPYLYSKRGIKDKRTNAGYLKDWQDEIHFKFINEIVEVQESGKLNANIWICSNFELNEEDEISLEELKADPYVKALLPLGWRVVIVEKKYSSSIITDKLKTKKKKKKAEVIFLNYRNIVGDWEDYIYYDYEDVYGKVM